MTRIALPFSAALLAAGLACGSKPQDAVRMLPTATVTCVPSVAAEGTWVAASLESRDQAVLATRYAGALKAILVREGDRVKAGQLLAQLDDGDLRGGRDAARAALDAAQAQQARIAKLFAQTAATQAELDQANTGLAQAKAGLEGAKANLRYTELRAPFDGTIRSRSASPGAFVGPGQPILTLDGGGLELKTSLTDAEAAGLKTGQDIAFSVDGAVGNARILALATGADPLTHRRDMRATVLEPSGLKPGAFARIRVSGVASGATRWIPTSALVHRGGLTGVFVVEDGKAALRWLSIGQQQGDRVEILAGLKADDPVVERPGAVQDGQPVEVAHGQ